MSNPRVKKPIGTLAERLKELRRRPLTQDEVNRLNEVFDKMEGGKKHEPEIKTPEKKIAHPPEAEL